MSIFRPFLAMAAAVCLCALACGCCCFGGRSQDSGASLKPLRKPTVSIQRGHEAVQKVAVLPFKAQSDLAGASVADLFVTEILGSHHYELVERSQIGKVLSESELTLSGLSDAKAAEVGSMMGADGVVIGTVSEYGTMTANGRTYAVVSIVARMIDSRNGKIMWSVDFAARADNPDTIPSELARQVVHEMMVELNRVLLNPQRYY